MRPWPTARRKQRDRATGQGSLFDALGAEASPLERALPMATEAPSRERLRWEKELLGLYLSDHPLGEMAAEMGQYVDAWSGDIGEGLDQQRVVVGGMAAAIRRVITRNQESMAVVTLEDLQGSVDVVVFPRIYAEVGPKLVDDAVLLFAGRVDHKGDETVILCDAVWTWEEATDQGRDRFIEEVAAADRGRGRRRNGQGNGYGGSNGSGQARRGAGDNHPATTVPVTPHSPSPSQTLVVPRVSPLRGGVVDGTVTVAIGSATPARVDHPADHPEVEETAPPIDLPTLPAEPLNGSSEPPAFQALAPDADEEPPLPDEARDAVVTAAAAATVPVEAGPDQVLHIRFDRAPDDKVVAAFAELKTLIRSRPGSTPIVLHIPAGAGRTQEMRLGVGIAYDADLVAEVGRRFGRLLQLQLR